MMIITFLVKKNSTIKVSAFVSYVKIGAKHVLKFSRYNYLLFLIILGFLFSIQQWKRLSSAILLMSISFFVALITSIYSDLIVKTELFRFLIPITTFSIALFVAFTYGEVFVKKEKAVFFGVIFFGLFNGVGFSSGFNFKHVSHQDNFIPIVGATLGVGAAVFLMVLSIETLVLVLKRIIPLSNKNWILGASLLVACCALPIVFARMFH